MSQSEKPSFWQELVVQPGLAPRTAAYYTAFVTLGLSGASLGPTLSGLAAHTDSQLDEISLLFTARSLGYLLGSFQGGRLYDRLAGHPVMAAGLLVIAAMMAWVPLISQLWLLVLALLVLGAAEGAIDVGGNTLLVWTYQEKVGPFMNGLHFAFGLGAFLSPLIVALAVQVSGDITWAYWALALLILPVAVWLRHLPSPSPGEETRTRERGPTSPRWVVLFALFFFLYVGAEVGFGGWIFTYAQAVGLSGETAAASLTSAFWGAFTMGRLLTVPLTARLKPRQLLLGSLVGSLLSLAVIRAGALAPPAVLWIGVLGTGVSMAAIFPTTFSLAERRMRITGRVTSWFLVGSSIGGMFLPWMIGQLFTALGPQAAIWAILLDMVVAGLVFTLLFRVSADDG